MPGNLVDAYGGLPFVSRLVMDFYDRVQESERLRPYFSGIDMRRLVDHQAKFISTLLGGPISYADDVLERLHADLAIRADDFDEMVELLDRTLAKFELADTDRALVVAEFRRRRGVIVVRN